MKKKRKAVKISIPEPCHENWLDMTPKEKGRHCAVCEKVVVDFSKFTDKEIYQYLNENKGANTCGRFSNQQLDKPIFEKEEIASNWSVLKYAASLFVGLGTVLSSKAQAPLDTVQVSEKEKENDNGNRQVIVTGQVLKDVTPIPNSSIVLPDSSIVKADSAGYYSFEYNGELNTLPITVESEELRFETTIEIGHLAPNHSSILNYDLKLIEPIDSFALVSGVAGEISSEFICDSTENDSNSNIVKLDISKLDDEFIVGSVSPSYTFGWTSVDYIRDCKINEIQKVYPIESEHNPKRSSSNKGVIRTFGPSEVLKRLKKIKNRFSDTAIRPVVSNTNEKEEPKHPNENKPKIEAVLSNSGLNESKKKGAKS
ncbi:MAG: hypothetical protein JXQ87_10030 [Bacteroidia bacterium]